MQATIRRFFRATTLTVLLLGPWVLSGATQTTNTEQPAETERTISTPPAQITPRIERRVLTQPEIAPRRTLTPPPAISGRGLTPIDPPLATGPRDTVRAVLGSDAAWTEAVVPVCWENMDAAFADGRAWTQAAVEATWEQVSALDFVGWDACSPTSGGIRIGVAEAGPKVAELGRRLDGLENGMVLNFTFNAWGRYAQPTKSIASAH